MNAEEAKAYLKANLAPLPKGYYWSVRDTPSLGLCRVGGSTVEDKQVFFDKRPYASNELLIEMVRASYTLADGLDVTSPATLEDIAGPYHFGGAPAKPKEAAPKKEDASKLSWWKRAINWLWTA